MTVVLLERQLYHAVTVMTEGKILGYDIQLIIYLFATQVNIAANRRQIRNVIFVLDFIM